MAKMEFKPVTIGMEICVTIEDTEDRKLWRDLQACAKRDSRELSRIVLVALERYVKRRVSLNGEVKMAEAEGSEE